MDDEEGIAIAVDSGGNAYVTGSTRSRLFPTTPDALQRYCDQATSTEGYCGGNAFIAKLNPTGDTLLYSTFLGGDGSDAGNGIALDSGGNAYVTGKTESLDFPTTEGALQPSFSSQFRKAYVTKISPANAPAATATPTATGTTASGATGTVTPTGTPTATARPTETPGNAATATAQAWTATPTPTGTSMTTPATSATPTTTPANAATATARASTPTTTPPFNPAVGLLPRVYLPMAMTTYAGGW